MRPTRGIFLTNVVRIGQVVEEDILFKSLTTRHLMADDGQTGMRIAHFILRLAK